MKVTVENVSGEEITISYLGKFPPGTDCVALTLEEIGDMRNEYEIDDVHIKVGKKRTIDLELYDASINFYRSTAEPFSTCPAKIQPMELDGRKWRWFPSKTKGEEGGTLVLEEPGGEVPALVLLRSSL